MILISTEITQQTFVLMKTSWRRFWSSSSEDVFKTSWSRRMYSPYSYVFRRRLDQDQHILLGHTSSRRFQDVFKTSLRHLQDFFKMFWKRLQDVSKRSPRRLQGVFKTFWKHLQDIFNTFSRLIIKLKCS